MGERLGELAAIGVVPPDLLERRAVGKRVIDRLVGIAHYVERVFISDLVTQVGWLARFFWRSHVPSLPERAGARPERGFAYGLGMGPPPRGRYCSRGARAAARVGVPQGRVWAANRASPLVIDKPVGLSAPGGRDVDVPWISRVRTIMCASRYGHSKRTSLTNPSVIRDAIDEPSKSIRPANPRPDTFSFKKRPRNAGLETSPLDDLS